MVELFHYALCPGGHLLLGSAEVVESSELFRVEDKKLCLYRRRNVPPPEPRLPVFPMTRGRVAVVRPLDQPREQVQYGALHQRMVERYAPPSVLVDAEDKVVHLSEHAGRYLVHPGGKLTANVGKLVREELRIELGSLLQTARETGRAVDSKPIGVQFNGHPQPVVLHLRPSLEEDGLVLIIFDERESQAEPEALHSPEAPADETPAQHRIAELEEELHKSRQRLQAAVEEFEASQEQMKASNEEMQSTNEELRSTLEELETSKEELQSINEELQTVNQENRHKVEELSQLSSDLHNLLAATDIATLFLDRELRIMRFTPKLGELFNVRQTDRGRPILDLTNRIAYHEIRTDALYVLNRLTPVEREVRDEAGQWYLTRVLPYRSTEDRIEGVVITFVDITTRKSAEEAARSSEQRLAAELDAMRRLHGLVTRLLIATDVTTALQDVLDCVIEITCADKGNIQLRDPVSGKLEIVVQRGFEREFLDHFRVVDASSSSSCGRALASKRRVVIADITTDPLYERDLAAANAAGYRAVQSTPMLSRDGSVVGVLSTHYSRPYKLSDRDHRLLDLYTQPATDYIDQHSASEKLSRSVSAQQDSERRYQQLFESIDEGFCIVETQFDDKGNANDYRFLDANPAFEKNTGLSGVIGRTMREVAPDAEPLWLEIFGRVVRTGRAERFESRVEALARYLDVYAVRSGAPSSARIAVLLRDVSDRKSAEERQRLLLDELNHRVKNTLATVQSIANQTFNTTDKTSEFVEKFRGRLDTLALAHDFLAQANWEGAELSRVLPRLLMTESDNDGFALSGPRVLLPPQAALSLALVIYELATNARKYGALSRPEGRVRVSWSIAVRDGDRWLDLDWFERDGPLVNPPTKQSLEQL